MTSSFLEQSLLISEAWVERHRPMSKQLLAKSSIAVVRGFWRWMIQIAKFPNLVMEPWNYRISGSRQQLTASSREQQTTVDCKPRRGTKEAKLKSKYLILGVSTDPVENQIREDTEEGEEQVERPRGRWNQDDLY
jgi:hypothetical protein